MSWGERVWALAAASSAGALLTVAASLRPDPSGMGTHTQLGLASCGWLAACGKPCPTCGMTTAFANAASANFVQAFLGHPAGAFFALCIAVGFWIALHTALTGSGAVRMTLARLDTRALILAFGILLAGWVYKLAIHTPA